MQGRHVAEQKNVELLQVLQRLRQPRHPARLHVDLLRAQRRRERLRLAFISLHEQHARLSAQADHCLGPIVFRQRVPLRRDLHLVAGERAIRLLIFKNHLIRAGLQRHIALLDQKLILVKFNR